MAKNDVRNIEATETAPKAKAQSESTYPVSEFIEKSRSVFGVSPECVITAFSIAGIDRATETKAQEIVKNFMTREVK